MVWLKRTEVTKSIVSHDNFKNAYIYIYASDQKQSKPVFYSNHTTFHWRVKFDAMREIKADLFLLNIKLIF